ncbi:50S ribosomal protein L6 [Candidatus Bathyarchaeota archaeon]|nr:50S ribosomal protein L6 [Candidatus Bathyarchaeota archaeon]RJS69712.1 MAG: 50S ribosomal protein L6 [Candidatus Bathyarchaeota archaeon]RLI10413.1 MAG: 50S ribosomal protein L6 [Candidatus Bathyarchaeota archaeon]RLI13958.1 MAG: 50S ribosomal protein L6 [Candidatus Bathyarchaeota archaeon]HDN05662.1 50S ribosomal protein L6 [Candidatus Bathyarchaeota archaeon]
MRAVEISKVVQVPDDVEVAIEGRKVTVKGVKGTLTRDFSHAPISMELNGKNIRVWAEWPRKKEAALVGTVCSHIQNMITGVRKGFTYKLKIVFSHFPISVKVKDKTILIENFTGERTARKARIMGDTQVKVQSEDIIVQGINLEDVSQTAANIEQATKVKRKDPRVFLDGIYVYEKSEGMEA